MKNTKVTPINERDNKSHKPVFAGCIGYSDDITYYVTSDSIPTSVDDKDSIAAAYLTFSTLIKMSSTSKDPFINDMLTMIRNSSILGQAFVGALLQHNAYNDSWNACVPSWHSYLQMIDLVVGRYQKLFPDFKLKIA